MEKALFHTAFGLYAIATGLAFFYLLSRNESLALWKWRILGIGLAFHLISLGLFLKDFWTIPQNRFFFPIATFYGNLSLLALLNAAIFFIVEGFARLRILGAFVLPWTLLAAGAALFASPEIKVLKPELQSYWLNIHPMVMILAYTAFANAFGVGLALLIQERQIKSRKPSELCYRLPSIEELDRLHHRLLLTAFPILTVGLLLGAHWALTAWGRFWGSDPKEIWAAITWILYAVCLGLREFANFRGRKTVYLSMAAFASVLVMLLGASRYSTDHGYLSGKG